MKNNNLNGEHIYIDQLLKIGTGIFLQEVDLMARLVNAKAGGILQIARGSGKSSLKVCQRR
ncbi:hypothetical protein [Bacillus cereus]|uniref:hypothetical protein n=1 Tax=Bacillus cereus TaxID=1396 RepID=UPI001155FDF1